MANIDKIWNSEVFQENDSGCKYEFVNNPNIVYIKFFG